LIQEVWGAEPWRCPLCSGLLRPIAIVETTAKILALLTPLGLARPHERPFALGPPRPEVTVLVDDSSQPDADDEPVFWPAAAAQAFPPDDGVQPDLSACSAQADAPE